MAILLLIVIFMQATSQIITSMIAVETRTHIPPSLTSTEYRNESGTSLSDKGGFSCPQDCACSHFTNPPNVQVVCLIETLEFISNFNVYKYNYNFSVFNDIDYPSQLLLFCYKGNTGVLDDAVFAGLQAFSKLKINCRIKHVSSQAFKGLTSLKTLIIEGGEYTEFDSEYLQVPDLSNLEEVSITGTNTKAAPSMCHLEKLRMVNISHNKIEKFANTGLVCDKPTNIGIIDISDNKLHDLVKDFGEITNDLQLLSVSRNTISYISPTLFTNMTQIEHVELDNNRIFLIPQGLFCNTDKITTLSLSHNNVSDMPEGLFSKLENLEFLRLENMTLYNNIWTSIANLTELKALYLSDNTNIAHFPINSLQNLKKLQIFDVSGGSLTFIPNGTFEKQKQMRLLNISENKVQTIASGSFKGLSNLTTLDLKHNEIIHIHRDALLPLVSLLTLNISYNNIPEVPKFPVSLRMLDLRHNDITFLYQNSFTGLIDLKEINMQFNMLKLLPRNIFITNKNLQVLELSHNFIFMIEYQSFSLNSPLGVLILNNNKISYIGYSFAPEYFSNLKTLDLSNNIERLVNPKLRAVFPPSIEELFLSRNYIFDLAIDIFRLPNLRIVDLRSNNIATIQPYHFPNNLNLVTFYLLSNPFDCDCNLAWLKKKEDYKYSGIFFISNVISDYSKLYCQHVYRHQSDLLENIPPDKFLCKYHRKCLRRCHNCPCEANCPTNCTCYQRVRFDDDVIDCSNANLTSIPGNLSLISKTFDLSGNHFPALEMFENFTRLTELQLQHCDIAVIHEGAFDCLVNLTILDLAHNLLTSLNSLMLRRVTKLKTLILQYNKISYVYEKTFENLPALSYLDLSDNNLNVISGYEFKSLSSVVQMRLANNPWSCDCEYLELMKNFTITHAHNLLDFEDLSCTRQNSTDHMLGKYPLADVYLPDFCDVYNHTNTEIYRLSKSAIAAMGIVLSITFLGLIAFGIIFWQREFLKVWCFVKFGWKFTGNDNKNDNNRPYDAFVSYSSHDEGFIVRELAPYLEEERPGKPGYRLCVHYRDFAVGASIAESIILAVKMSKRVIIVLSDNFLNSEWCHYEFQTVHHQLLEERKNRIIMVLLHNINLDMEDNQLKNYLKTRTYLKYGDPWFWAKLEYAMPKKAVHIGENMVVDETGPQPNIDPDIADVHDIKGGDYRDDDMENLLDNMRIIKIEILG